MTLRSPFFFHYSLVLAAAAVGGFLLNGLLRTEHLPPASPLLVLHGLLMLGWFGALVVQTRLVGAGRTSLHRRLGIWSVLLAAGTVAAAGVVAVGAYEPGDEGSMILPNAAMLLAYSSFYALGLRARRRDLQAHKRWMVLAGAAMLGPSLGRIVLVLGAPGALVLPLWLGMLAPMWVHDVRRVGRVHRVTVIGSACIVGSVAVASALSTMEPVRSLLGYILGG